MSTVLLINGPNLALLGKRQTNIYGHESLNTIVDGLKSFATENKIFIRDFQSNSEGDIVSYLNKSYLLAMEQNIVGIIINPAAYTHTSVAIHDALEVFGELRIPIFEVHLSNVFAREEFRQKSLISPIATGVICGLGSFGYRVALQKIIELINLV